MNEDDDVDETGEVVEENKVDVQEISTVPFPFNSVITLTNLNQLATLERFPETSELQRFAIWLSIVVEVRVKPDRDVRTWYLPPDGFQVVSGGRGKPISRIINNRIGEIPIQVYTKVSELVSLGFVYRYDTKGLALYFPECCLYGETLAFFHHFQTIVLNDEAVRGYLEQAVVFITNLLLKGHHQASSQLALSFIKSLKMSGFTANISVKLSEALSNDAPITLLKELSDSLRVDEDRLIISYIAGLIGSLISVLSPNEKLLSAADYRSKSKSSSSIMAYLANMNMITPVKPDSLKGMFLMDKPFVTVKASDLAPGVLILFSNSRVMTGDQWKVFDNDETEFVIVKAATDTVNRRVSERGNKQKVVNIKSLEESGLVAIPSDSIIKFRDSGKLKFDAQVNADNVEPPLAVVSALTGNW